MQSFVLVSDHFLSKTAKKKPITLQKELVCLQANYSLIIGLYAETRDRFSIQTLLHKTSFTEKMNNVLPEKGD